MKALKELLIRYPTLEICKKEIQQAYFVLKTCFFSGGKLLVCGNGGSAADSEHIVGELMKGYLSRRPLPNLQKEQLLELFPEEGDYLAENLQGALPAISLVSHSALITAFSNDVAPDMIFAQQVLGYGKEGDVLLALSTSGNSRNVLYAVQVARSLGVATLGMTGAAGGKLLQLAEVVIRVPETETPKVQELHLPIYHALCEMLEASLF